MSDREFIRVRREGHVTIMTIDRPEVMNALHYYAHRELEQLFDDLAADPDQWVAVLTGAGDRAFCAGNDLKHHATGGLMSSTPSMFGGLTARFDLAKPVIAAVNGVALGGGFELALACDVIVASESASFGLPEPRVGQFAGAGGLLRLPSKIGLNRALELALTARRMPADEAVRVGLASRVVPAETLLETALEMARAMCALSPASLRATKQIMLSGIGAPIAQAMEAQWSCVEARALAATEDVIEGPRAFAEKRAPVWGLPSSGFKMRRGPA